MNKADFKSNDIAWYITHCVNAVLSHRSVYNIGRVFRGNLSVSWTGPLGFWEINQIINNFNQIRDTHLVEKLNEKIGF